MKHRAMKEKLKSKRGSGLAEALVGFLICVLSVLILLSIVTTTTELIKKGDDSLAMLYAEEAAMEKFNCYDLDSFSDDPSAADGTLFINADGTTANFTIEVQGDPTSSDPAFSDPPIESRVAYFETLHHHLLGFKPY